MSLSACISACFPRRVSTRLAAGSELAGHQGIASRVVPAGHPRPAQRNVIGKSGVRAAIESLISHSFYPVRFLDMVGVTCGWLGREWNGQIQRVAVLADGFAWNGKTYPSLSKVAVAITGTRWSGPKFFGLRDKPRKGSSP